MADDKTTVLHCPVQGCGIDCFLFQLELMGPTGPNSSSCGGLAIWRTQGLAALASITITEKTKRRLKINVIQTNISTDQNSLTTGNNYLTGI